MNQRRIRTRYIDRLKYQINIENIILRVIDYAIKKDRFTLYELKDELNLNGVQFGYVKNTLTRTKKKRTQNPNHILVLSEIHHDNLLTEGQNSQIDTNKNYYTLLPSAFFHYIDYEQIVAAKQDSKTAYRISMLALIVAGMQLIVEWFKP